MRVVVTRSRFVGWTEQGAKVYTVGEQLDVPEGVYRAFADILRPVGEESEPAPASDDGGAGDEGQGAGRRRRER